MGAGEVKAPVQVWPGLGRTGHSEWGEGAQSGHGWLGHPFSLVPHPPLELGLIEVHTRPMSLQRAWGPGKLKQEH